MKTGVYQIRNLQNRKLYIGSAASKGFSNRWNLHKAQLQTHKHHSIKLQRAWHKYGTENFVFEILLYCDPENCLFYEQIALDHYKPEYNICKIAGSCLGIKRSQEAVKKSAKTRTGTKRSIESKKRMSKARIGRFVGVNSPSYGRKLSLDTRQKISNSLVGFSHSQETKLRISVARRGEKNPSAKLTQQDVIIIRQLLQTDQTQTEIALKFGVSRRTIGMLAAGKTWNHHHD